MLRSREHIVPDAEGPESMKLYAALLATIVLASCSQTGVSPSGDGASANASSPIACAKASYYADSLAGNPTASGTPYDPAKLTAAHKTLAFGTKLRVVRDGFGEVRVTVNDRGPFIEGRVIDLSRAAAEKIDMITAGVADVCIYLDD